MEKYFELVLLIVLLTTFIAYLIERKSIKKITKKIPLHEIKKVHSNPIIKPGDYEWRQQGTFNPAAVQDKKGIIHMLYRAISGDGISRLGYAKSSDGIKFDDSLPYPVFALQNPKSNDDEVEKKYDLIMYPSGGSWGGVEDPRMVSIDGEVHMTYNAFDSWDSIRIGHTSISEKDLSEQKWNWKKPSLISPKGEAHKNWVLFPEKIGGKFAILHSLSPEVKIDYVNRIEDLAEGKQVIKSSTGHAKKPPLEKDAWDTWVRRRPGPPPIKTSKGWLVLYHTLSKKNPDGYKLGAILLNLKNPKKVIARAPAPLLIPDCWYEHDWKPNVIYACGAIIKNKILYIYYGGGDKYVCAAHTPILGFLNWMTKHGTLPEFKK